MNTSPGMAKIEMGVFLAGVMLALSMLYLSFNDGLHSMPGHVVGSSASAEAGAPGMVPTRVVGSAGLLRTARPEEFLSSFSDDGLELLNGALPLPESERLAQIEADRLAVQLRRFGDRYGTDSVAARSVRLRLDDLAALSDPDTKYAITQDQSGASLECDRLSPATSGVC